VRTAGAIALWTTASGAALPFLQDVASTHFQTVDVAALNRIDLGYGGAALLAVAGGRLWAPCALATR
jgi:hypothetical protein